MMAMAAFRTGSLSEGGAPGRTGLAANPRRLALLPCGLLCALLTTLASAQPAPVEAGAESSPHQAFELEAQRAFDRARELMSAGDYAEACPLLEQSQQLDPGLGTQFRLAECYEGVGRLASAWQHYLDVANTARKVGMDQKEIFARTRAAAIRGRVPHITVRLALGAPPGTQIHVDGELLEVAMVGQPLARDPGKHEVTVTVPGQPPRRSEIVLTEGVHQDISVGQPEPTHPAAPTGIPSPTVDPEAAPEQRSVLARYPWSFVTGGLALAFAGAGIGVGAYTLDHYGELSETCAAQPGGCPSDDRDAVEQEALATNLLFGAAVVSAAAAALLVLTGESAEEPTDSSSARGQADLIIGPGGAGLAITF